MRNPQTAAVTDFTIYSRSGCHLCERMHEELAMLTAGFAVRIRVVDVDDSESLRSAYGEHVPVLVADDEEICRHRLDVARVRSWLEA